MIAAAALRASKVMSKVDLDHSLQQLSCASCFCGPAPPSYSACAEALPARAVSKRVTSSTLALLHSATVLLILRLAPKNPCVPQLVTIPPLCAPDNDIWMPFRVL